MVLARFLKGVTLSVAAAYPEDEYAAMPVRNLRFAYGW